MAASLISLISKENGITGDGEFWIHKDNGITVTEYPITVSTNGTQGLTHVVSGIIFQWGTIIITSSPFLATFAQAFPTICYNISLTMTTGTPKATVTLDNGTITTLGFSVTCDHTPQIIYYLAIGM